MHNKVNNRPYYNKVAPSHSSFQSVCVNVSETSKHTERLGVEPPKIALRSTLIPSHSGHIHSSFLRHCFHTKQHLIMILIWIHRILRGSPNQFCFQTLRCDPVPRTRTTQNSIFVVVALPCLFATVYFISTKRTTHHPALSLWFCSYALDV